MARPSDPLELSKPVKATITLKATAVTKDAVNPAHYRDLGNYSALHVVEKWGLGYHLGNALKYIQRAGKKEGATELTDLRKARWYLQRHLHLLDPENEVDPAAE